MNDYHQVVEARRAERVAAAGGFWFGSVGEFSMGLGRCSRSAYAFMVGIRR